MQNEIKMIHDEIKSDQNKDIKHVNYVDIKTQLQTLWECMIWVEQPQLERRDPIWGVNHPELTKRETKKCLTGTVFYHQTLDLVKDKEDHTTLIEVEIKIMWDLKAKMSNSMQRSLMEK